MFSNVADYISKHFKFEGEEEGVSTKIWSQLFEKIQEMNNDHRAEFRRTNILTLGYIYYDSWRMPFWRTVD